MAGQSLLAARGWRTQWNLTSVRLLNVLPPGRLQPSSPPWGAARRPPRHVMKGRRSLATALPGRSMDKAAGSSLPDSGSPQAWAGRCRGSPPSRRRKCTDGPREPQVLGHIILHFFKPEFKVYCFYAFFPWEYIYARSYCQSLDFFLGHLSFLFAVWPHTICTSGGWQLSSSELSIYLLVLMTF